MGKFANDTVMDAALSTIREIGESLGELKSIPTCLSL